MNMVIQITLCVLLILGFAWLLWMLSGALLTPVRSGRGTRITLVARRTGTHRNWKISCAALCGCVTAARSRRTFCSWTAALRKKLLSWLSALHAGAEI